MLEGRPSPDRVGQADRGDRQAGLPALLRGRRPDQRQGLRERGRLRHRQRARLRQGEVKWTVVPFNSSYAPGPEEVRLRRQPDLDHAGARRARGLLDALLHRPAGRRRAQGLRRSHATGLADLKDAKLGVQIGTTSLDAVNADDQAVEAAAGLQRLQRRRPALKHERVDAIVVDLPTALLHDRRPGRRREDRRPVRRARRRRLGRAAEEGLRADAVREPRRSTS